jgi:hypothetical protein
MIVPCNRIGAANLAADRGRTHQEQSATEQVRGTPRRHGVARRFPSRVRPQRVAPEDGVWEGPCAQPWASTRGVGISSSCCVGGGLTSRRDGVWLLRGDGGFAGAGCARDRVDEEL